ncbi:MAG: serine/threonine-protein kinase [Phycisphaerae bacterium]
MTGGDPVSIPPALRISSYRIVDALGEGSMGVVYRAEQDNPHRVVALKVLRAGGASTRALKRFEHEAQVLGRLQHPGIAQIFEAGTADTGYGPQPFFAMELIKGMPLNEYADNNRLSVRQRLALLVRVCEGVQHAHQKGIIHRDLKPGNILVDETGQPKILDFGIALATDQDIQATTSATDLREWGGTIPYMSFEQVKGDPHDLDTRTDVYALGVIGFQLLAGCLPYDLKGKTVPEAARIIEEQEPRPLGTINRAVRGDVETIIGKALQKDKARRYQSASDLATDIKRFLSDQPILARPPSTWYQFRKFARRNRALVGGVAGMFVMLLAAIVGTSVGMKRAVEAREKATAISMFLDEMLASPDPTNPRGKDVTFLQVLDEFTSKTEEGSLGDQPEVEAAVRVTLGKTYRSLALFEKAENHLASAMAINLESLGAEHPQTLTSMNELAMVLEARGELSEAEQLYKKTLETQRRVLGDEHPETLDTVHNLAGLYKTLGKLSEAESLYRRTLAINRRVLGDEHKYTLALKNNLAHLLKAQGKLPEAEQLYRQTLESRRRILGGDHPATLTTMNNLAALLREQGKLAEAEQLYGQTLESRRRKLGEDHSATLTTMNNLAALLRAQDKLAEAERLYRDTTEALRRKLGDQHRNTLTSMHNLAIVLYQQEKLAEAEKLYRETSELFQTKFGDRHPSTLTMRFSLAVLLADKGDYTQAESLHRQILELRREVLPKGHPDIASSLYRLGSLLLDRGDPAGSEPLLRECVAIRSRAFAADDWRTANANSALGACLNSLKRFEEAEPLLLQSYPNIKAKHGESDKRTRKALQRIIDLYVGWGKTDKAAEFRARKKVSG